MDGLHGDLFSWKWGMEIGMLHRGDPLWCLEIKEENEGPGRVKSTEGGQQLARQAV